MIDVGDDIADNTEENKENLIRKRKSITEISDREIRRRAKKDMNVFIESIAATSRNVLKLDNDITFPTFQTNNNFTTDKTSDYMKENHLDKFDNSYVNSKNDALTGIINTCHNKSFTNKIASWIVKHNISRNAGNELLEILRNECFQDLPMDSRSLLSTPRSCSLTDMEPGKYHHLGLKNGLSYIFKKYSYYNHNSEFIYILVNIDGLPLSKSSNSQLWPILVSIDVDDICEPFVVGIYHGAKKPNNCHIYLEPFINEYQDLTTNGILISTKICYVKLKNIICDAPAKAFILAVKGHNGYHGCNKCIQEGHYINGRMTFPEMEARLRTDEDFRNKKQEDYHLPNITTPLIRTNIDLVKQIPLDYMHLICLGVVKRLINFWIKGNKEQRMFDESIRKSNEILLLCRKCLPKEFARLPRPFEEIAYWKAVELRQFCLYTGPIVLKNNLRANMYQHFLCLFVATRILCSALCRMENFLNYAKLLLNYFISQYKKIYGEDYITYNVHNLLHLVEDCNEFGPLDNFSAFKFENYLSKIKKWTKQSRHPLQQIINRIVEKRNFCEKSTVSHSCPLLRDINYFEQTVDGVTTYFNKIVFQHMELDVRSKKNCYCIMQDDTILILQNIGKSENGHITLIGKKFLKKEPYFKIPCLSSKLDIYVASCLSETVITYSHTNIRYKCICISFEEKSVIIPLLHTD